MHVDIFFRRTRHNLIDDEALWKCGIFLFYRMKRRAREKRKIPFTVNKIWKILLRCSIQHLEPPWDNNLNQQSFVKANEKIWDSLLMQLYLLNILYIHISEIIFSWIWVLPFIDFIYNQFCAINIVPSHLFHLYFHAPFINCHTYILKPLDTKRKRVPHTNEH